MKISTFADTCELNFGYSLVLVLACSLFKNKPYGAVRTVEFESKPLFSLFFFSLGKQNSLRKPTAFWFLLSDYVK